MYQSGFQHVKREVHRFAAVLMGAVAGSPTGSAEDYARASCGLGQAGEVFGVNAGRV
jgi:hypothetical protein